MERIELSKNKLSRLDSIRLIAAFMIIVNHCFREEYGFMNLYGAEFTSRWTVPFFFMVSGFFMKDKFMDIVKYCLRIFVVYLSWTLIYALILGQKMSRLWDLIANLRNGIIMPFWYFPSLLMCTVFVWALSKLIKSKKMLVVVCALLYIIALCGDTFKNVPMIRDVMDTYFFPIFERIMGVHDTRDGIFNGSLFMAIGLLLRDLNSKDRLSNLKNDKRFWMVSIILFALYIVEICINVNLSLGGLDVLVTTPLFVTALFLIGFSYTMNKDKGILCRNLSTLIYLTHYMFLTTIQQMTTNQWIWLLFTMALSVCVSWIVILLSKKIKVLGYLY